MIETLILWLPIPALVGVFLFGFALAWWLRSAEVAVFVQAVRDAEAKAAGLRASADIDRQFVEAVRAAVEQHTVMP